MTRRPKLAARSHRAVRTRGLLLGALFACALLLAGASSAGANEDSERLAARGLVDFHAGRYGEAAAWFAKAVGADPDDASAQYYEGMNQARLGDLERAEAGLRRAVERPGFDRAALELGYVLVRQERYEDAVPYLAAAGEVPALEGPAALFLGVAHLRAGRFEDASTILARAATHPAHRPTAVYLQGVAAYRAQRWQAARDHFEAVLDSKDEGTLADGARSYLERLPEDEGGRLALYANVALQYDSNATLAPTDDLAKTFQAPGDQSDFRSTIEVGARAVVASGESWSLDVGYEFFQSLHFELSDLDIQDHSPSLRLTVDRGLWRYGAQASYDYYLADNDELMGEVYVQPWVSRAHGESGRTDVYAGLRRRDFFDGDFRTLEGNQYAAGLRRFFYLGGPEDYALVGYRFDLDDVGDGADRPFAYQGHQVELGLGWMLPGRIEAEASYSFHIENYDGDSGGRDDDEHRFALAFRRRITQRVAVVAEYFGHVNDSNDARFEYDRHVGSLALEVR